jgi:hypothetical protein
MTDADSMPMLDITKTQIKSTNLILWLAACINPSGDNLAR